MKYFFCIFLVLITCIDLAYCQTVPSYVPPQGLKGWWEFNGNAQDGSGNGNHFSVQGATLSNDRFGNPNSAYSYNGLNNYCILNDHVNLRPGSFAISVWVLGLDFSSNRQIFAKNAGNGVYESIDLVVNNSNGYNFMCNIGGASYYGPWMSSPNPLPDNQWKHLVFCFDDVNNIQSSFVDGVLAATSTVPISIGYDAGPWSIGAQLENNQWNWFFNGKIDDIGFWNRPLTAPEVLELFNAGSNNPPLCSLGDLLSNDTTICRGDSVTLISSPSSSSGSGFCFYPEVKTVGNVQIGLNTVTRDSGGNYFLTGSYSGNVTIGGVNLPSLGGKDIFLAKFDSCGVPIWVNYAGSSGDHDYAGSGGGAISCDVSGNVYLVGRYNQSFTFFGSGGSSFIAPFSSTGNSNHQDGFLVKVSPSGQVLWGASLRGSSNDGFNAVTVDGAGAVVVAGGFNGCCPSSFTVTIFGPSGSQAVNSFGSNYGSGLVVKFSPTGNILWHARVHNRDTDIRALVTDQSNNVYLTSSFRSWNQGTAAQFIDATGTTNTLFNPGIGLAYLVKLNASGVWQWGRTFGNAGEAADATTHGMDVDVDSLGNPWVCGYFRGATITFYSTNGQNITQPSSSLNSGFLVRYNTFGVPLATNIFRKPGSNVYFNSLSVGQNEIGVAGYYSGNNRGADDILFARYSMNAGLIDSLTSGGPGIDQANSITKIPTGFVLSGSHENACILSGAALSNSGTWIWNADARTVNSSPISVLWSTGDTTAQINVNPTQTTSYTVTFSNGVSTCTDTVLVIVNQPDTTYISDTIVQGQSYLFNGQTLVSSGQYFAVFTNIEGCDSLIILSLFVELNTQLDCNQGFIAQNDTGVCMGIPIFLSVRSNMTHSHCINQIGTYNGKYIYTTCDSFTWNGAIAFVNSIGQGAELIKIEDQAKNNYLSSLTFPTVYWIGLKQNRAAPNYSEPAGGWFWMDGSTPAYVNWGPFEPNNDAGVGDYGMINTANGTSIAGVWNDGMENYRYRVLFESSQPVNTAYSFLWSTGDTTANIFVSPSQSTTYYVTISNGVSTCTDSVRVNISLFPTWQNLFSSDTITACNSLLLSAPSGYFSYLWNTGDQTPQINVNQTGWYSCIVGYVTIIPYPLPNPCPYLIDSVYVIIATAGIVQNDTSICVGSGLNLTTYVNGVNPGHLGNLQLVDQFTMTFMGPFNRVVATDVGATYQMVISGVFAVHCDYNGQLDAAYAINHGSAVNHQFTIWNGQPVRPSPDVYNPSHIYTYNNLVATQSSQQFIFVDNPYWDNCGSLNFSIYKRVGSIRYLWSTGDTTPAISVMPNGDTVYTVEISNGSMTCTDTIVVDVVQHLPTAINVAICEPDRYLFGGQFYDVTGTFHDTIYTQQGCDSIVTLNLRVKQPTNAVIAASVCATGSFWFGGHWLSNPGTYRDTLVNADGCDSIVILNLTLNQQLITSIDASICPNGSYFFGGRTYFSAGIYRDTLLSYLGCDSIILLNLTMNQPTAHSFIQTICAPGFFPFGGNLLNSTGIFRDTLANSLGCDSIVILNLIVNQPSLTRLDEAVCFPASYSFGNQTCSISGIYHDTLTNLLGCDSIVTLNLDVDSPSATPLHAVICAPDSFAFGGQSCTGSGIYRDTLLNYLGCDSVVSLNLLVNVPTDSFFNVSICSSGRFWFGGQFLYTAGIFRDTLTNFRGCDSVATLNLVVNQPSSFSIYAMICAPSTYSFGGVNYSNSGIYYDTAINFLGCDSIISLHLMVNQPTASFIFDSICAPYGYNFGGQTYYSTGTYRDTVPNFMGCDSIVTLNLFVRQPTNSSISAAICYPMTYLFGGQWYSSPGTYQNTLINYVGCDSIVTLSLVVNQPTYHVFEDTICSPGQYFFAGTWLNQSGTYRDTAINYSGCDSLITLALTVLIPDTITINQEHCDSFAWNGQVYNQSGDYTYHSAGSNGCDSITILRLRLNYSKLTTQSLNVCDSIWWNGVLFRQSGNYEHLAQTTAGCDSIVRLNLIVSVTPDLPLPFDTVLCKHEASIVEYPFSTVYNLNWYNSPTSQQAIAVGNSCSITWTLDTTVVYISNKSTLGCESERVPVRIINENNSRFPIRPNAFTPDGDGLNDQWIAESRNELMLQVFDRWGRLLHESRGQKVEWDGKDYSQGTYPYKLIMWNCSGKELITNGLIQLIR